MSHRALVALSGGGAKGLVHIGALKALEDRKIEFVGLAGTSAGAIVAALKAAGFTSEQIINTATNATILDQLSAIDDRIQKATDFFGKGGWMRVRMLRFFWKQALLLRASLFVLWLLPVAALATYSWLELSKPAIWLSLGWLLFGIGAWWAARRVIGGLADVGRLRSAFGELIRRKMFPNEPNRIVLMKDFGRENFPTLKIVSANLSRGALHLFSAERTPNVPVADAVMASICLPIVFEPLTIQNELHVDGGIVSNLPAWPFDEERELDPEALTIAIEIENRADPVVLNRYSWIPAAINTAMFGRGELNLRVSGPAERLALPTTFDLLDFDQSAVRAAQEVKDVAAAVTVQLDKRLLRLPRIYNDACRVAQALAQDELGIAPAGTGEEPRVRVSLGKLERGYVKSLRMSHSVGYEKDTDEGILLPIHGTVAGKAWSERSSQIECYPLPAGLDLPGPGNRLRRKYLWNGVQ